MLFQYCSCHYFSAVAQKNNKMFICSPTQIYVTYTAKCYKADWVKCLHNLYTGVNLFMPGSKTKVAFCFWD